MNPCQGLATGIAGELNRLAGGVLSGGTVNCAVDTALPGQAEDFFNRFTGFESGVSAHQECQLATVGEGFDGQDSTSLGGSQRGNSQKPDGSRAEDRYGFAGADRCQAEGMHCNR